MCDLKILLKLWDSLGPSPALALSHITARLTVTYQCKKDLSA